MAAAAGYRALTDLHSIQQLLAETVAQEAALDERLEGLLLQRTQLAGALGGLEAAQQVLDVCHADACSVSTSVAGTCSLSERVSSRVRELDRAQQRVADTVARLDAVVQRRSAFAAATASLASEDFEAACDAVATYLALESSFPGLSPAAEEAASVAAGQHAQLLATKRQLEDLVRTRFATAVGARRHGDVLRFAVLFPKLGCAQEGASQLVAYLRSTVAARARADAEALSDALHTPTGGDGDSSPTFVSTLSGLFKDVAQALDEHEELLRTCFGLDTLLKAALELHAECDARGSALLKRFSEHHGVPRLVASCARRGAGTAAQHGGGGAGAEEPPPDPRTVEGKLEEALGLCAACEEYTTYLLARVRACSAAGPDAAAGAVASFRSGAFSRCVLDLVGSYISLEEYFMAENISKAIRIDELVPGALTSSLVDDCFFILLKCGRRSGAAGSVQCTCAVLNHVAALLAGDVADALQAKLKGAPQRLLGAMNQAASCAAAAASAGGAGTPAGAAAANSLSATQTACCAAAACVNNMDVAAEYVHKLRSQLEAHALSLYDSAADRERIRTCLADLGDTAAAFARAAQGAADELAGGVAPRLRPLVDAASVARYELSDAEYAAQEAGHESWALRLLGGAEAALAPLQPLLTAGLFDAWVQSVVDGITHRLEAVLWQRRFNALGALALDRDLRTLMNGLSGLAPRTVRDKFARLSQLCSCVNLEEPEDLLDMWGDNAGALTWRLSPAEVRRALGLRLEFRQEAIVSLRL
jgi:hypothetical protein